MHTLEHNQSVSPTAVICENLERFGGAPNRDEPDPRAIWDRTEALLGIESVLDTFIELIVPDGVQLLLIALFRWNPAVFDRIIPSTDWR